MQRSMKAPLALSLAALLASVVVLRADAAMVNFDLNYNFGTVNAGGDVLVTLLTPEEM
jgi:hypothetical protein